MSALIEALGEKDQQGKKYRIKVVQAGLSGNKNYYPDVVLKESLPLFDGVRVFAKSDAEHLNSQGKSFNQLIGKLSEPQFIEGKTNDSGHVEAIFDVLQSSGVAEKLLEAYQRGMTDTFGFSMDALGKTKTRQGRRVAKQITKINSVDLIIEPGAGGELIQLIEALQPQEDDDMSLRKDMVDTIKAKNNGALPENLNADDDAALQVAFREALQSETIPQEDDNTLEDNTDTVSQTQLREAMETGQAKTHLTNRLASCSLNDISKSTITNQFKDAAHFTEAQVDAVMNDAIAVAASYSNSGKVSDLGGNRSQIITDGSENLQKMIEAFWNPQDRSVNSFKDCYIALTGDSKVTGQLQHCDQARLREAMGDSPFREALDSSSFANVLGDSITRRVLDEYNNHTQYDVWKQLADVVPVGDFRTQERVRYGGYGDLPAVAESGTYNALASPTDEKATYAISKRGGTENITLEMIKNDDVGAIRRIPMKLTSAAKRTLGKFVMDFIRTNPAIYDAVTLFHATHNNLTTAALAAASLSAARLAMLKQTEAGSGEQLSIPPTTLWIPPELEETAVNLFNRSTENDKTFLQSLVLDIIPVWYWTDVNDWALSAALSDIPMIEIGFLDGNEEPEIYVQDSPTNGSLFNNDTITYKIKHTYGGAVMDYRGLHKAVVI